MGTNPTSIAAAEFDASPLAPAKSPADYRISLQGLVDNSDMAAVGVVDASLREAAFAMGLSATSGGSVMEMGARSAKAFEGLDEAGQTAWKADQLNQLRAHTSDVAVMVSKVDRVVEQGDPEVMAHLSAIGFFSAPVIVSLAAHADRLALRRGMK